MAKYIYTPTGAKVSVADDKVLPAALFKRVDEPKPAKKPTKKKSTKKDE